MPLLGDLAVNMTANTGQFQRKMAGAQVTLQKVGERAGQMAAAASLVGVGLVKLAADAETLEVKFRVLLKSGEAARMMMQEIGKFAASTPFQKLDIADAAQKLLAFNVPAERVMQVLKNIGDISALTGNRIGELAELYGKANVQGRLFMEDINQLTGRGIPIIQELAKQFGVAESEVRDLVSAGQVSATNIERAFADMTAAGGQFANGMEQLSQTTAGKFSTLKDNVVELGAAMGKFLLPIANKMLSVLTRMVQASSGWAGAVVKLGIVFTGMVIAIKTVIAAIHAYSKAIVIAQALSGQKGWAALTAGLAVAATSIAALNYMLDENEAAGAAMVGNVARAEPAIVALGHAADQTAARMERMSKAQSEMKNIMESLRTPAEEVAAAVERARDVLQVTSGFRFGEHELLTKVREKASGFTDAVSAIKDELRILRGEATETGLQLEKMLAAGVDPAQVDKLRKLFAERDAITEKQKNEEYWRKRMEQEAEKRARSAKAAELEQTAAKRQEVRFAGAQQRGSAEAFATIVRAMANKHSPQVQEQKKTNKILIDVKKHLKKAPAHMQIQEPV